MQVLEKEFTYKAFIYKEVIREDKFAVYEYTNPKWESKRKFYDTITIKILPSTIYPNGITVPEHQSYPRDRDFGNIAWCYNNLEQAMRKFNELKKDKSNKI
jgi:hypothetical protein